MTNKIIIGCLAVTALIFGVLFIKGQPPINVSPECPDCTLGAFPGPNFDANINISGTLTTGGKVLATTTSGTATTLKFSDLDQYSQVDLMSNVAAFAYTMPATSTMLQFLPDDGDSRTWIFHNATSTAAATLTIVKGAGMFLVGPSANDDLIGNDEYATLTCTNVFYRSALNVDIVCIVEKLTDVD